MAPDPTTQHLRDRLAELDAQIPILEAERRKIQRKLRTLVFPVLTLPAEITSEIFTHCLPPILPELTDGDDLASAFINPSPLDAPHLFLQICRQWRDIALGTRRLWASLRVTDQYWDIPRAKPHLEAVLSQSLNRAVGTPLTLFFRRIDGRESWVETFTQFLFRAPQLRDATFVLTHEDLLDKIFCAAVSGRIPNLQRLHIYAHKRYRTSTVAARPITTFEVAPNLTVVELSQLSPSVIRLPWSQLTQLSVDKSSSVDCVTVLRLTTSLILCSFASIIDENDEDPPATLQDCVLPRLQSLSLAGSYSMCEDIISHLTLPALTALGVWIGDDDKPEELVSCLSRSRAALHNLDLVSDYENFTRVLPFMERITSLELNTVEFYGIRSIFRSLRDSTTFLPHLRSLRITLQKTSSYSDPFTEYDGPRYEEEEYDEEFERELQEPIEQEEPEEPSEEEEPFEKEPETTVDEISEKPLEAETEKLLVEEKPDDIDYDVLADALEARSSARAGVARLEAVRMVWLPKPAPWYRVYDQERSGGRESWDHLGFDKEELCRRLANGGTLQRFLDLVADGMDLHIGTRGEQWVRSSTSSSSFL